MNKVVEFQGMWWLPEQPDNQVFGSFTFAPNTGVSLELQGKLHSGHERNFSPSLIIGIANSGEYINIVNGRLTHQIHAGSSGFDRSTLTGEMAFTGKHFNAVHFDKIDEIKFRRLSIHYAHLDEWLAEHLRDFVVDRGDFSQNQPMTIQYMPTKAVEAEFKSHKVVLGVRYNYKHSMPKQVTITQKAVVEIAFAEAKSLDDCFYFIYQVRNFLTLGLSVPTYPLQILGLTETEQYLNFLYAQPHLPQEFKLIPPQHILFTFPDIQENFQPYMANWFRKAELLKPVYDLYFSTRYNPHEYLQSTFLSLTQALETYHRRIHGGVYLPTEEYLQKVYPKLAAAIPKDLGSDFKQSMKKGTLRYANQFSLRKRLKDMTAELAEQGLGITFLYTKESQNNFVENVVDTRNYLTHYDPDSPVETASSELLDLVEKLRALLEIYLLREVGFDFPHIRKMTARHWKYELVFRRRW